jgi:hypothetical protein
MVFECRSHRGQKGRYAFSRPVPRHRSTKLIDLMQHLVKVSQIGLGGLQVLVSLLMGLLSRCGLRLTPYWLQNATLTPRSSPSWRNHLVGGKTSAAATSRGSSMCTIDA